MKYIVLGTNKTDGFGAQYIANICCFIKCRSEGHFYKHVPYTIVDHNYDKNKEYPNQLNEFTGLKSDDLANINNEDIAIHIRRGDVSTSKNTQRFIKLKYYSNIIDQLIREHGKNVKIIIFSEGNIDDFQELAMYNNITFMLNTNLLEAVHTMVCAPIFVMGYSALSCCIALLSKNIVYYTHSETWSKQCIPKKKEWIYIE